MLLFWLLVTVQTMVSDLLVNRCNQISVPMIQQATVGVGIIGKEGNQAKMSSDFAIPKFRMLKRLLAVHGRYSFKRAANFIQYYIYMDLAIALPQIIYAFYTMFSGQSLIEEMVAIFSTLFFMQLNPLSFALFEKDISEKYLEDAAHGPKLYAQLRKENIYNPYTFVKWIGGGVLHMIIVVFICLYATENNVLSNGKGDDFLLKGVLVTSCAFLTVNLKCYIECEYVTIYHHIAMIFSLGSFYIFNLVYATADTSAMYFVWFEAAQSSLFWLVHVMCVVSTLGIDLALHTFKQWLFPDYYQQLKFQS